MNVGPPCSESSTEGTVDKGARSEKVDSVRERPGQRAYGAFAGEEDGIKVDEVGTGVG